LIIFLIYLIFKFNLRRWVFYNALTFAMNSLTSKNTPLAKLSSFTSLPTCWIFSKKTKITHPLWSSNNRTNSVPESWMYCCEIACTVLRYHGCPVGTFNLQNPWTSLGLIKCLPSLTNKNRLTRAFSTVPAFSLFWTVVASGRRN